MGNPSRLLVNTVASVTSSLMEFAEIAIPVIKRRRLIFFPLSQLFGFVASLASIFFYGNPSPSEGEGGILGKGNDEDENT